MRHDRPFGHCECVTNPVDRTIVGVRLIVLVILLLIVDFDLVYVLTLAAFAELVTGRSLSEIAGSAMAHIRQGFAGAQARESH